MARRLRRDWPGAWHHVVNRGVARRTVFENSRDIGSFLDLLDRTSRAGVLEVHAYSFLTTHFHLLVRSPRGLLSRAMKDVENAYVRLFNRRRGRDGPLFRSRFWSGPIDDESYWRAVLRYIDRNPVAAGLCSRSTDYPHGSAWWFARGGGPSCLNRTVIESVVSADVGCGDFRSENYPVETPEVGGSWTAEIVERRMHGGRHGVDPLSDLVRAGPVEVQDWMLRNARLADGTAPGFVLVSVRGLREAIESEDPGPSTSKPVPEGLLDGGRSPLLPALLRLVCGLSLEEAARECGLSPFTIRRRMGEHHRALAADGQYRRRSAEVLMRVLDRESGEWKRSAVLPARIPFAADHQEVSDTFR